jgi:hypothetical protein
LNSSAAATVAVATAKGAWNDSDWVARITSAT